MGYQIYSNCIGTYVFKDKKLVDEILLKKEDIPEHNRQIAAGGQTETDKAMLKKYAGAEVIGIKAVPPSWVLEASNDAKKLALFRQANILVTKRKVAESLNREYLVVQAINNIEEIDKVANNLSKRLREWYELYNPEFSKSIESHEKFSEIILKKKRKELLSELGLSEEQSMGADFSEKDIKPVMDLAEQISALFALRERQVKYVETSMKELAPNVEAIAGAMIGAKLLAIAGSLEKLALFPASTLQLLGAEKALFRHIKTGARPPKFGVIINHPFVAKAKPADKGKTARMLADKLSIAAKIDFFKGEFRGEQMKKELEEKLK
jgi:nucleolar protein 56